jgi:hypothetical protein
MLFILTINFLGSGKLPSKQVVGADGVNWVARVCQCDSPNMHYTQFSLFPNRNRPLPVSWQVPTNYFKNPNYDNHFKITDIRGEWHV